VAKKRRTGGRPSQGSKSALKSNAAPTRKERKELIGRARRISKEIPRLVYKYRAVLTADAQWDLCDRTRALRKALKAKDFTHQSLQREVDDLDAVANRHFVGHRKSPRRLYVESIAAALLVALFIRAFLFEAYRIPSGSMIPTLKVGDYLFVSKFVYGVSIPFTNVRLLSFREPTRGEVVIFGHPKPGPEQGTILIKRVMAIAGDRVCMKQNIWYVTGVPLGNARVLARKAPCQLSPQETCGWVDLNSDAPLDLQSVTAKPGCPCTYMEESTGNFTWVTQHPWPNAICGCSEEGSRGRDLFNIGDWPGPTVPFQHRILPGAVDFMHRDFLKLWPDRSSGPDYMSMADDGALEMTVPDGHVFVMGDNRDNSDDGRFWGVVPVENIKGKALFIWWAADDFFGRVFRFVH